MRDQMATMTIQELQMIEFAREVLRQHGHVHLVKQLGIVVAKEKVLTNLNRAQLREEKAS